MKTHSSFAEVLSKLIQDQPLKPTTTATHQVKIIDPVHYNPIFYLDFPSKTKNTSQNLASNHLQSKYKGATSNKNKPTCQASSTLNNKTDCKNKTPEKTYLAQDLSNKAQLALLTLGIESIEITESEVKNCFKRLAKLYHPDGLKRRPQHSSNNTWLLIANAYDTLREEISCLKNKRKSI